MSDVLHWNCGVENIAGILSAHRHETARGAGWITPPGKQSQKSPPEVGALKWSEFAFGAFEQVARAVSQRGALNSA
jgi:hypothetical protein